jgi:hypothetical protein
MGEAIYSDRPAFRRRAECAGWGRDARFETIDNFLPGWRELGIVFQKDLQVWLRPPWTANQGLRGQCAGNDS